jgi:hypothetical protein
MVDTLLKKKEQFVLSTIPRMAEYTFPFITSVFGVKDETTGEHLGSGLRCILNGRRTIVTALHVIKEAEKYAKGGAVSAGYGLTPIPIRDRVYCLQDEDIAIYPVPDDYPHKQNGVDFWTEERIARSDERLSSDYLFGHGFPQSRSQFFRIVAQGVANKSLPFGTMQRLENLPGEIGPNQFALDFDPGNMSNASSGSEFAIDPHGLCGSPVWRIGVSGHSAADWKPEWSLVVGFLTQWRPDDKLLIATRASQLLAHWRVLTR